MRNKVRMAFVVVSIFSILLPICVFAHSGRTDSNGGHHVTATGEYHYHHGYPAHSHPGGECPYEKKSSDQTRAASNSNSGDAKSSARTTPTPIVKTTPKPSQSIAPKYFTTPTGAPYVYMAGSAGTNNGGSSGGAGAYNESKTASIPTRPEPTVNPAIMESIFGGGMSDFDIFATTTITVLFLLLIFVIGKLQEKKADYKSLKDSYAYLADICKKQEVACANLQKKLKEVTGDVLDLKDVIPPGVWFDDNDLPRKGEVSDLFPWGEEYTFFTHNNMVYHTSTCEYGGGKPVNAIFFGKGDMRPCRICNPQVPDCSWYWVYKWIKKLRKKYGHI